MGRPPKVSDDTLKQTVRDRDSVIITTSEVADACSIDRRTADTRLKDHPELASENHGRTRAWFLKENDPYLKQALHARLDLISTSLVAVVLSVVSTGLTAYVFNLAILSVAFGLLILAWAFLTVAFSAIILVVMYRRIAKLRAKYLPGHAYTIEVPIPFSRPPADRPGPRKQLEG